MPPGWLVLLLDPQGWSTRIHTSQTSDHNSGLLFQTKFTPPIAVRRTRACRIPSRHPATNETGNEVESGDLPGMGQFMDENLATASYRAAPGVIAAPSTRDAQGHRKHLQGLEGHCRRRWATCIFCRPRARGL